MTWNLDLDEFYEVSFSPKDRRMLASFVLPSLEALEGPPIERDLSEEDLRKMILGVEEFFRYLPMSHGAMADQFEHMENAGTSGVAASDISSISQHFDDGTPFTEIDYDLIQRVFGAIKVTSKDKKVEFSWEVAPWVVIEEDPDNDDHMDLGCDMFDEDFPIFIEEDELFNAIFWSVE